MKNRKHLVTASVLMGFLALSGVAAAAEGVLFKAQVPGTNYCHLRFPAISRDTLFTDRPALQAAASGNMIDFYGSCDHDPLGTAEVRTQRQDYHRDRLDND